MSAKDEALEARLEHEHVCAQTGHYVQDLEEKLSEVIDDDGSGPAGIGLLRGSPELKARYQQLKAVVAPLVEALEQAQRWHQCDKWRFSTDRLVRAAWKGHAEKLDAALTLARSAMEKP